MLWIFEPEFIGHLRDATTSKYQVFSTLYDKTADILLGTLAHGFPHNISKITGRET